MKPLGCPTQRCCRTRSLPHRLQQLQLVRRLIQAVLVLTPTWFLQGLKGMLDM